MIFVTGDTHGEFNRFSRENFPEQKSMTKEDMVLICGDFGGLWDGSKQERWWLDWLEDKPFTTLFVSGNHENYDLLAACPKEERWGGIIQTVRPSILHLTRGQVFQIGGTRIFTLGGASSHDIDGGILDPAAPDFRRKKKNLDARRVSYRILRKTWWEEELPSDGEYQEAERNLNACGRKVDFIVTHCAPSGIEDALGGSMYRHDRLTDYLEELRKNCQFRYWFFGHYHDNRMMDKRYVLLYEQIIQAVP